MARTELDRQITELKQSSLNQANNILKLSDRISELVLGHVRLEETI